MQYLALRDQVLHRACDVLDRHRRIDPMLVEQINTVGLKPLQHAIHRPAHVFRPAVEASHHATGF